MGCINHSLTLQFFMTTNIYISNKYKIYWNLSNNIQNYFITKIPLVNVKNKKKLRGLENWWCVFFSFFTLILTGILFSNRYLWGIFLFIIATLIYTCIGHFYYHLTVRKKLTVLLKDNLGRHIFIKKSIKINLGIILIMHFMSKKFKKT